MSSSILYSSLNIDIIRFIMNGLTFNCCDTFDIFMFMEIGSKVHFIKMAQLQMIVVKKNSVWYFLIVVVNQAFEPIWLNYFLRSLNFFRMKLAGTKCWISTSNVIFNPHGIFQLKW